jgi:hypothetical protein
MKKTQLWLQELYNNPDLYAGKIVSILNDTQIIDQSDSFGEAKQKAQKIVPVASKVSYFQVPHGIDQVFIPTLKIQSLRK